MARLIYSSHANVAVDPAKPCGHCEWCERGHVNLCPNVVFMGAPPTTHGAMTEQISAAPSQIFPVPDNFTDIQAVMLEPLGVAIHASKRANLAPSSTAIVFGAGAVGLLVSAMAKISGCSTVLIADIDAGRVQFAVENGFAHRGLVVPAKRSADVNESLALAKEVATNLGNVEKAGQNESALGEVDAVFECTGVPSCLQAAIYVCEFDCRGYLSGGSADQKISRLLGLEAGLC